MLHDRSGRELLVSLMPLGGWTACPGWGAEEEEPAVEVRGETGS